jgi:hypothetical protein
LTLQFATVPPKSLSKRARKTLEAGGTVWRDKHPTAPALAALVIEAFEFSLDEASVVKLTVEKTYGLESQLTMTIEPLA